MKTAIFALLSATAISAAQLRYPAASDEAVDGLEKAFDQVINALDNDPTSGSTDDLETNQDNLITTLKGGMTRTTPASSSTPASQTPPAVTPSPAPASPAPTPASKPKAKWRDLQTLTWVDQVTQSKWQRDSGLSVLTKANPTSKGIARQGTCTGTVDSGKYWAHMKLKTA